MLFGGFVGLVVAGKLIGLTVRRSRKDYEADQGRCLACGRCFDYCPVGRAERKVEH
jgi:NosR/NirI family nitrous oxide reductase transcriptional regulator